MIKQITSPLYLACAAILGIVAWRAYRQVATLWSRENVPDNAYADTYYIVANVHLLVGLALAVVLPFALYVIALRRSDNASLRRGGLGCVVLVVIGLLLWSFESELTHMLLPRRFVEDDTLAYQTSTFTLIGMTLVSVGSLVSVVLSLFHLSRRRKSP